MSEPLQTQRLKIKIGDAEFEAEGPTDLVRGQYEQFLEVVRLTAASAPQRSVENKASVDAANRGEKERQSGDVSDEVLARTFQRSGDAVSLLSLPRTEEASADALVALLYGFHRLLSRQNVTGSALMSAARQSGLNLTRIDREIDARTDLLMVAGTKRGRRYGLNNRGIRYAEDLVRGLIG